MPGKQSQQSGFDFGDYAARYARGDFVLGACNALAADRIDRWPDWPGHIRGLVLVGPEASGKSHLGAIWREASKAMAFDKIDATTPDAVGGNPHILLDHPAPDNPDWPEDVFFHLLNAVADADGSVLILSRIAPGAQGWRLGDLASRLNALMVAEIGDPDDAVLEAMLQKIADDRGLVLPADMTRYIARRMERSAAAAARIIADLDALALARKQAVSRGLVQEVLEKHTPKLL